MSRVPSSAGRHGVVATSVAALLTISVIAVALSALAAHPARGADSEAKGGSATSVPDKYAAKVPGGLAFSEFKGYEAWETIAISNGGKLAVILGNPAMIKAYKAGIPGNGQPFPDGARMAKIHWDAVKSEAEPGQPLVPGTLHDVDFMVKDSKRFADSGGWGYAQFEYDAASDRYRAGTTADQPPQSNDAKCGFACHTIVKAKDYVFTAYGKR